MRVAKKTKYLTGILIFGFISIFLNFFGSKSSEITSSNSSTVYADVPAPPTETGGAAGEGSGGAGCGAEGSSCGEGGGDGSY